MIGLRFQEGGRACLLALHGRRYGCNPKHPRHHLRRQDGSLDPESEGRSRGSPILQQASHP